jgi:capsular polysaccharide transport system permease protein
LLKSALQAVGFKSNVPAVPAPPVAASQGKRARSGFLFALVAMSPSLLAAGYYGLAASDRYVSEASFIVRSSTRSGIGSGFAAFLQLAGITSSQDDTFAVHDFFLSHDAVHQLLEKLPLRTIYGPADADVLARFPGLLYGSSTEELRRYMKSRIYVEYNSTTGISLLRVQAFDALDAQKVASTALDLGEAVINRLNRRIRDDAVKFAVDEVTLAEKRMLQAQLAISEFRNREAILDPGRSSFQIVELVGKLSAEMSSAQALLLEMSSSAPGTPQVAAMQRRVDALRQQIAQERARMTDTSDGLAQKVSQFEQLMLERELAGKRFASAVGSLDAARKEARSQQLYLERISGPSLADSSRAPRRAIETISVFFMNGIALLVLWLFRSGIAEHGSHAE